MNIKKILTILCAGLLLVVVPLNLHARWQYFIPSTSTMVLTAIVGAALYYVWSGLGSKSSVRSAVQAPNTGSNQQQKLSQARINAWFKELEEYNDILKCLDLDENNFNVSTLKIVRRLVTRPYYLVIYVKTLHENIELIEAYIGIFFGCEQLSTLQTKCCNLLSLYTKLIKHPKYLEQLGQLSR